MTWRSAEESSAASEGEALGTFVMLTDCLQNQAFFTFARMDAGGVTHPSSDEIHSSRDVGLLRTDLQPYLGGLWGLEAPKHGCGVALRV